MKKSNVIHDSTVKAVAILVEFFTPEQRDLLAIKLNNQTVTLMEQLIGRWWSYVPVADNVLAFRAAAARVVAVHAKGWADFMKKLKEDDIFSKLLDPDNYSDKSTKETVFKMTDKKSIDSDSSGSNLVRSIGRTIGGEGGISKAYDYGSEWDRADRERLDKMKVVKEEDKPMITTETGEEDDTRGSEAEEQEKNVKGWITKKERLDLTIPRRDAANRSKVSFSDGKAPTDEQTILLHGAQVAQSSNATAAETLASGNTFIDSLKRQNYDTTRNRLILANAINAITNIEFMDVREKIYKELDKLFIRRVKACL